MNYADLKTEIVNDPAGLGYAGKSDAEIAALGNDATRRTRERDLIPSHEIVAALVPADVQGLSAAQLQILTLILAGGTVNIRAANVRTVLAGMFGAGSATRANLVALQSEKCSRFDELGFGFVRPGEIGMTRAAP